MRPKDPQNGDAHDLFRSRLDQIVDLGHPLAKLARVIDWDFLKESFGAVYTDATGRPPFVRRQMVWDIFDIAGQRLWFI